MNTSGYKVRAKLDIIAENPNLSVTVIFLFWLALKIVPDKGNKKTVEL